MASHFRTPEAGAGAPSAPDMDAHASHFALSSDAGDQFAQQPAPGAPADPFAPQADPFAVAPGDTGAFLASAGGSRLRQGVAQPSAAVPPVVPVVPTAASPLGAAVPDPLAPAAPVAPEISADQRAEVADLDAALSSADFTTFFAPVEASRKEQARQAGVDPVILFEHVTKVYPAQPNKPALDDVNIEIYPGEFVLFGGPLRLRQDDAAAHHDARTSSPRRAACSWRGRTSCASRTARSRSSAARSAPCSRTSSCCRARRSTRTSRSCFSASASPAASSASRCPRCCAWWAWPIRWIPCPISSRAASSSA